MRYFIIFILCTVSICSAQEKFHNDEFGFTVEVPVGWNISSENEGSDSNKVDDFKTLLMLNPSGVKAPKSPCIKFRGKKLQKMTTSEAIAYIKKRGKEEVTANAQFWALGRFGQNANKHNQVDVFYDYNSAKNLAIAKILYQNNNTYFLSVSAKIVGLQRVIDFHGYWKGENPEEFWQVFNKVIDSFEFDSDTAPKGSITSIPQEIKENMSKPVTLTRVTKWISWILGILIVAGIVKAILFR